MRPRNPLNIGAAARAMANFGFGELAVVAPYQPTWQETRSAIGAEAIVESARAVDTLAEAIGDCTVVVGTTCGSRRSLNRELIALSELPAWLARRTGEARDFESERRAGGSGRAAERAALLFGSEKTGLTNEHLSYCHALVRIPTTPECPSMNLGQSVAVCCYELARAKAVSPRPPAASTRLSDPANLQSLGHLLQRATRVLDESGYLKPRSREATLIKLRRLLLDLRLTSSDAKVLGGILAQIEWKLGQH